MKNDKYALRELTPRMAPSRGHITLGRVTQRGWVVCEPPHDHRGEAIMDGRRSAFLLVVIGVLGETSPVIRTPSACLKNVGVSGLSVWLTRRRLGGKAPWLGPSLPPPPSPSSLEHTIAHSFCYGPGCCTLASAKQRQRAAPCPPRRRTGRQN